jgi:hypothetical protein
MLIRIRILPFNLIQIRFLLLTFFPGLDSQMIQNGPIRLPHVRFDADPVPDPAFHFDADPEPAFHFDADPDADPDPSSQTDADPRGSRSATLPFSEVWG